MTSREYVKAAIDHRETDRVPYAIDLTAEAWERLGEVAGGLAQEEFIDNDVKSFSAPWWTWHELEDDRCCAAPPWSLAKTIGRGSYDEFITAIKSARETSDKYLLVRIYGSHFEKAYFARGLENFLADMAAQPQFARALLRKIIDKNLVMLENILALDEVDGVLLGSDRGSQRSLLMSPSTWEEMIRPGEQEEYDLIHAYGKDVWIHSCGCITDIIGSLVDMGVDVLNPVQPEAMDLRALKEQYGDRLAFWGGISTQKTLPYGLPEDVKEEA